MKKGINQWAFSDTRSVRECMELAKKEGFDGIELVVTEKEKDAPGVNDGSFNWFFDYQNNELTLDTKPADVEKLKKAADEVGIEVPSITTTLLFPIPLSSTDPVTAQRARDIVRTMLDFGAILGCESVLVVPGVVTEADSYDVVYENSRAAISELARHAEKTGVTMAIENVWNKFLLSPIEFARFLDEVGSDSVKAYFDVGNILLYGFPNHWIKILGDRLDKIHICDFKTSVGTLDGFVNVLEGDLNYPLVVKALQEVGYDGYVTAEISPPYRHHTDVLIGDLSKKLDVIFKDC